MQLWTNDATPYTDMVMINSSSSEGIDFALLATYSEDIRNNPRSCYPPARGIVYPDDAVSTFDFKEDEVLTGEEEPERRVHLNEIMMVMDKMRRYREYAVHKRAREERERAQGEENDDEEITSYDEVVKYRQGGDGLFSDSEDDDEEEGDEEDEDNEDDEVVSAKVIDNESDEEGEIVQAEETRQIRLPSFDVTKTSENVSDKKSVYGIPKATTRTPNRRDTEVPIEVITDDRHLKKAALAVVTPSSHRKTRNLSMNDDDDAKKPQAKRKTLSSIQESNTHQKKLKAKRILFEKENDLFPNSEPSDGEEDSPQNETQPNRPGSPCHRFRCSFIHQTDSQHELPPADSTRIPDKPKDAPLTPNSSILDNYPEGTYIRDKPITGAHWCADLKVRKLLPYTDELCTSTMNCKKPIPEDFESAPPETVRDMIESTILPDQRFARLMISDLSNRLNENKHPIVANSHLSDLNLVPQGFDWDEGLQEYPSDLRKGILKIFTPLNRPGGSFFCFDDTEDGHIMVPLCFMGPCDYEKTSYNSHYVCVPYEFIHQHVQNMLNALLYENVIQLRKDWSLNDAVQSIFEELTRRINTSFNEFPKGNYFEALNPSFLSLLSEYSVCDRYRDQFLHPDLDYGFQFKIDELRTHEQMLPTGYKDIVVPPKHRQTRLFNHFHLSIVKVSLNSPSPISQRSNSCELMFAPPNPVANIRIPVSVSTMRQNLKFLHLQKYLSHAFVKNFNPTLDPFITAANIIEFSNTPIKDIPSLGVNHRTMNADCRDPYFTQYHYAAENPRRHLSEIPLPHAALTRRNPNSQLRECKNSYAVQTACACSAVATNQSLQEQRMPSQRTPSTDPPAATTEPPSANPPMYPQP